MSAVCALLSGRRVVATWLANPVTHARVVAVCQLVAAQGTRRDRACVKEACERVVDPTVESVYQDARYAVMRRSLSQCPREIEMVHKPRDRRWGKLGCHRRTTGVWALLVVCCGRWSPGASCGREAATQEA